MAYANSAIATHDLRHIQTKTKTGDTRKFLRRLFNAMMASRKRQAEHEIALYLASRGFNDESERDIERLFLSRPPYR